MPGINPANVVYDFLFRDSTRDVMYRCFDLLTSMNRASRSLIVLASPRLGIEKKSYTTFAGLIPGMEKKKFVHVITITKNNIVPNLALYLRR